MEGSTQRGSQPSTWDALAAGYDANPYHHDRVSVACILQAVADLQPAGRVLECGCGTGLVTRHLLGAEHVHALDWSPHMLNQVERKFSPERVTVVQGDLRELPYPDDMFDRVLTANVLQHVTPADQPRAAAEIMRVLKPGGRYAVSVHHYSRGKQCLGWAKEGKTGQPGIDYIYFFTRDDLKALFPNARIRAIGFYGRPAQLLITRTVGHLAARLGHGNMICAYGKKPAATLY
jgi:SAM-dependent methyltransferase